MNESVDHCRWVNVRRVFADEVLLEYRYLPWKPPSKLPPADEVLRFVTGADPEDGIGQHPPLASVALPKLGGPEQSAYQVVFGRDSLLICALLQDRFPQLGRLTCLYLAAHQGVRDDSELGADKQRIGQIPHEMREQRDPRAIEFSRKFGFDWPYFGSFDATPLFASAVVRVAAAPTGSLDSGFLATRVRQADDEERSILECLVRAVRWVQERLAENEEGILEAGPASNHCWQVWADSPDAYCDADGLLAEGKVASIEVQAWAYDALVDTMALLDGLDERTAGQARNLGLNAADLDRQARQLREAVLTHFWVEDCQWAGPSPREFFVRGTDRSPSGELRPLGIRSSNAGHLLDSHILEGEQFRSPYVESLVRNMWEPEYGLRCPSGIRTLSKYERRFREGSYHNGSVWPWDNAKIARGFSRHGFEAHARELRARIRRVCEATKCYPEHVRGSDDLVPRMVVLG